MKNFFTFFLAAFLMIFNYARAEWTIVASYDIPGKASGLATDGNMLYFGIYGANGNQVYVFDPASGSSNLLFTNSEIGDSYGMTFKDGSLWILDRENSSNAYALELSLSGEVLSQIDLQDTYMSGIAAKPDGFWVSTYYPDPGTVYEIDESGTVLSQFTPPNNQVWDLCLQDNDLWMADYNANMLYKTTSDGTLLESQSCENEKPAGIVYDGAYLWYVDGPLGGTSKLYKVDLTGSGTPAIQIPQTSHQFSNTTINETDSWEMEVQNNGTADLIIENINIPEGLPVSANTDFPLTIAAGAASTIEMLFQPEESGFYEGVAIVASNDPINPQIAIELSGHGLFDGPFLLADHTSVDFGTIRTMASKKQHIILQNYGDEVLQINEIELISPHFYTAYNFQLPINISPLGMLDLIVWYFPQQENDHSAEVAIINNGSESPFVIQLDGQAQTHDYVIGEQLWSYQVPESFDESPKAMTPIADITGDGKSDLVVCTEDNIIRVINGNASGTSQQIWEREIYSGAVYQQDGLATIPDMDDDGYEDIIVGTAWGDRSIVALSGKTGQQIWKHSTSNYGGGGWVYQVDASTDFNGDEFPDVLAAAGNNQDNNGPRRAYCLDGKTGDVIWEAFLGGAGFSVIAIEDVNGDAIPDALAGCSDAGETQGFTKAIDGSNGSILWTYPTSGTSVWALAQLDDINQDGVKDVIAGSFNGQLYLLDATNGDLLAQGFAGNNIILRLIPLGDINADGLTDIAMAYSGNSLIVYDGQNGDQLYSKAMPDKAWNVQPIPDITGDLIADLAAGTLYQSNYAGFYDGSDGAELFSAPFGQAVDGLTVIPDMTGDYSWEMVVGGREGKIVCYSGGLNAPVGLVPLQQEKKQLSFYPNPAKTEVWIEIPADFSHNGELSLRAVNNQIVYRQPIDASKNTLQLDVSWLAAGVYTLELKNAFETRIKKLIIAE
ncbi:MAG: choice-of-anchor D domain-containing protein [Bacteroidetes bacterium]|jgi:hypothetical protein|nr:choice-of-anchor D domain-containing protein [Bacteroidota bacterium]